MSDKLNFDKPIFNTGVNVTIRPGTHLKHSISAGDSIRIDAEVGTKYDGAYVLGSFYICLCRLPEEVITQHHDPHARTRRGLYKKLTRLYGGHHWDDVLCSIISFVPVADETI